MPRAASTDEPLLEPDLVRVCVDCRSQKSIRGVWYLVPGRGAHPFVCETCYANRPAARAAI